MDKILGFIKSPMGKLLIILLVVIIVSWVSLIQYQKSIYKGKTKSQLINYLAGLYSKSQISWIRENDENVKSGGELLPILEWYDENSTYNVSSDFIVNSMTELGIEPKHFESILKSKESINKKVILVNFI